MSETAMKRTPEELSGLFQLLETQLVETEGEITPEIQTLLDTLEVDGKDMVDRYASFIKHLKARHDGLKMQARDYANPLERRANAAAALADRLQTRLHDFMKATKQKELKGDFRTVKEQLSPEALVVTDAGKLPKAFPAWMYHEPVIDTAKVKTAAKEAGGVIYGEPDSDGKTVELARVSRGTYIRIY